MPLKETSYRNLIIYNATLVTGLKLVFKTQWYHFWMTCQL